jgi:hypothetical protein
MPSFYSAGINPGALCLLDKRSTDQATSPAFFWGGVRDRVSLCIPGCPGAHFVDQAGLELRNPPASASQVLGLKACATTAWLAFFFKTTILQKTSHRSSMGTE